MNNYLIYIYESFFTSTACTCPQISWLTDGASLLTTKCIIWGGDSKLL